MIKDDAVIVQGDQVEASRKAGGSVFPSLADLAVPSLADLLFPPLGCGALCVIFFHVLLAVPCW